MYWVARSSRAMTAYLLLPRLQLARRGKQLRPVALDDARRLGRRLVLAEVQFLDAAGALFDLVGGNQDLADVFIGLAEMGLQFQHAVAQPRQVVAKIEHF